MRYMEPRYGQLFRPLHYTCSGVFTPSSMEPLQINSKYTCLNMMDASVTHVHPLDPPHTGPNPMDPAGNPKSNIKAQKSFSKPCSPARSHHENLPSNWEEPGLRRRAELGPGECGAVLWHGAIELRAARDPEKTVRATHLRVLKGPICPLRNMVPAYTCEQ